MLTRKVLRPAAHHERSLPLLWDDSAAGPPALAFVHIPKTAGTWFAGFLAGHFDPQEIAPPLFAQACETDFSDPTKYLFYGHFLYANLAGLSRNLLPITFLRDPIARTISQYRSLHNRDNFTPEWREACQPDQLEAIEWIQAASFDDFVRSDNPNIIGHIQDVQTFYLATDHGEARLNSAIANLERFFFVGIQELSQTSLALFRHQTGSQRPWIPTDQDRNASKRYPTELSKAGRERLHALTENDRKLYAAALRLFDGRVAQSMTAGQA